MLKPNPLLIRHAESEFNLAMRLAKNSEVEVKLEEEDLDTKFSLKLIDAAITQTGLQQCMKFKEKYMNLNIDLVVVSPLFRALQTAHYIFHDHPNHPKFIVEPYLREIQLSACDISSRLTEAKQLYPYMDFSRLGNSGDMWCLDFTYNKDKAQKAKEYVRARTDDYEKGQIYAVEYLRLYGLETDEENLKRIEECKQYLKFDVPFVCVSHSRTIEGLAGKYIGNCECIEFKL